MDAATLHAYTQTHYRVLAEQPFALRIGRHSARLQSLHAAHHTDCSAFVTACNPYSQPWSMARNSAAHQALRTRLAQHGWTCLPGYGRHPAGRWPAERSLLVPGLGLAQAQALGTALRQNALVWAGADAVPRLVLLR